MRYGKERHTIPEDIGGGEGEEEMVKVLDGEAAMLGGVVALFATTGRLPGLG